MQQLSWQLVIKDASLFTVCIVGRALIDEGSEQCNTSEEYTKADIQSLNHCLPGHPQFPAHLHPHSCHHLHLLSSAFALDSNGHWQLSCQWFEWCHQKEGNQPHGMGRPQGIPIQRETAKWEEWLPSGVEHMKVPLTTIYCSQASLGTSAALCVSCQGQPDFNLIDLTMPNSFLSCEWLSDSNMDTSWDRMHTRCQWLLHASCVWAHHHWAHLWVYQQLFLPCSRLEAIIWWVSSHLLLEKHLHQQWVWTVIPASRWVLGAVRSFCSLGHRRNRSSSEGTGSKPFIPSKGCGECGWCFTC